MALHLDGSVNVAPAHISGASTIWDVCNAIYRGTVYDELQQMARRDWGRAGKEGSATAVSQQRRNIRRLLVSLHIGHVVSHGSPSIRVAQVRSSRRGHAMKTCRLLRLPEVIEITGLGRDTIYRYIREGRFPRQRRISQRASGWREDEIRAWVDSRPAVEPSESKESPLQT
jgi:prophage regulatory protein